MGFTDPRSVITQKTDVDIQHRIRKAQQTQLIRVWSAVSSRDTWKFTKILDNRFQLFIGKSMPERTLERRKWGWISYNLRKTPGNITRNAFEWNSEGERRVGRPLLLVEALGA